MSLKLNGSVSFANARKMVYLVFHPVLLNFVFYIKPVKMQFEYSGLVEIQFKNFTFCQSIFD